MIVCAGGNLELLQYLVDKFYLDIGFQSKNGTPLISAIQGGHLEIVQFLVEEKKVDCDSKDKTGVSPLYVATYTGNLEIVRELVMKNVDPSCKGPKQSTVLHVCAERNFFEIGRLIIESYPA